MDSQLVGKISSAACGLDGVHVADHVGNRHVGRGKFFHESLLAAKPRYRRGIAFRRDSFPAGAANRKIGIVVNLAAGHDRNLRIEKSHQAAQNPRLCLPAQAEQNEMMPREHGIGDLGYHRVVVAVHAGKNGFALLELLQKIFAKLLPDGSRGNLLFRPRTAAKLTQILRLWTHSVTNSS